MRFLPATLGITLWVTLTASVAQAHASPDPLETEVHVLADDTDDSYALYDGFDIQDLYVREASFPDLGDGIVLRVYLYGGFGPTPTASEMQVDFTVTGPAGDSTARIVSTDGATWSGDAPILEEEFEPTEEGAGSQGYVQVFMDLDDLGAATGDDLSGFTVATYADDDLRDISPGGRPVPGTDGAVMAPGDTSEVLLETLTLQGPVGYTSSSLAIDEAGAVTVTTQNRISTVGQHIVLAVQSPAGWDITLPSEPGVAVEAGEHPTFRFTASATPGSDPAQVHVRSDLGGLEILELSADRVPVPDDPATPTGPDGEGPDATDPSNGTPLPVLPVLAALVAVASLLRRR